MILITDWFDVVCLVLGIISIGLMIYQFSLYDWNIEECMFTVEDDDDGRRIKKISKRRGN